jgi:hypothetical protein
LAAAAAPAAGRRPLRVSTLRAGIDVSRILQPAAELRRGAAQRCVEKQNHPLDMGLDIPTLIPLCQPALPADPKAPVQPVYLELDVKNTNRCGRRLSARAPGLISATTV